MKNCFNKYMIFVFSLVLFASGPPVVLGKSFVYPSKNGGNPCIFLDVNFTIVFTAFNNTVHLASQELTHDDVVSVSGSCAPATITLSFTSKTNWTFQFNLDSNGDILMQRTVHYKPIEVFLFRLNDMSVVSVKEKGSTNLFKAPFSFQCDKPDITQYTSKSTFNKALSYTMQVKVLTIRVQGFNGENVNTPIMCVSDNNIYILPSFKIVRKPLSVASTTVEPTNVTDAANETSSTPQSVNTTSPLPPTAAAPTTMTTTPHPEVAVNKYIVSDNNMHCIVLQGAITITIDYLQNVSSSEKPTTKTVSVDIPANSTGTGNCNLTANSQNLVISFLDDWSLEIVFTLNEGKISDVEDSTDLKYGITNLTLTYVKNATLFPGSDTPPETEVVSPQSSKDIDYPKKSNSYDYYKCNKKIRMKINDEVTVETQKLLFRAFNTNNGTDFNGQADQCAADEETDQIVPIAVACTLGGLTLIVVICYAIGKLRKKE